MAVQRVDPDTGEPIANGRVQVRGDRLGHGAAGALERLADQPRILAADIEQLAPGFPLLRSGHCLRGYSLTLGTLGAVRALYVDLDGTLLGPGGGLFRDADKAFTLQGARAVEACTRAGVEVVVTTGRRPTTAIEIARLLGQTSAVFEMGAGFTLDDERHWLTGEWQPTDERNIYDQIDDSGAPALLLEHFAGRLEPHHPWTAHREVSHLMRGLVDVGEADALLAENGLGSLVLLDNGSVHRRSPALAALPYVRCYHLVPAGVSKAAGVLAHARARGYEVEDCVAVGDSREDLRIAENVGTFWLVANGLEKDESLASGLPANVRVTEGSFGAGVYEAVVSTLAARGAPL